jgi:hypothetical protein
LYTIHNSIYSNYIILSLRNKIIYFIRITYYIHINIAVIFPRYASFSIFLKLSTISLYYYTIFS